MVVLPDIDQFTEWAPDVAPLNLWARGIPGSGASSGAFQVTPKAFSHATDYSVEIQNPNASGTGGRGLRVLGSSAVGAKNLLSVNDAGLAFGANATLAGNLFFATDNTYDIGATSDLRPRDVFIARNLTVTGNETVLGNAQLGDASTDAHTIIGSLTVRNEVPTTLMSLVTTAGAQTATIGAAATPGLYVDVANTRTIVGSTTALTSAANDRFTVSGGTSYFAGPSGSSIGLRYNASQTVGWQVGVDGAGANKDLLFLDDGPLEIIRMGDTSSADQLRVSGNLKVTGTTLLAATALVSTEKVRVGGDIVVDGIIHAAGGQISFPAVQNPSAGVNVLDDYEEGTWTPSLGGSATYTLQSGLYTKIGRLVIATGELTVNALGTGSTTTISGLPFTIAGINLIGAVGYYTALAANVTFLGVVGAGAGTSIQFSSQGAAGPGVTFPAAIFGNGAGVQFVVAYHA